MNPKLMDELVEDLRKIGAKTNEIENKKLNNVVKFPKNLNRLEKQVEAIVFAADEPLDVETIEKRVQSTSNIKKILENLQSDYTLRGINLVCIKDKWSFRTSTDLVSLMYLQKSTERKLSRATLETLAIIVRSEYLKKKDINFFTQKKLTQQMSDDNVFPSLLSSGGGYYGGRTLPSIVAGKRIGTMLGKKLQVRSESRTLKNSRLDSGRIDKRLIAELGFGNSKVFSTTFVEQYNDSILHISVDASGSMGGDKWKNTMTAVVAICKAASMISGLDVVVSFRTTHHGSGGRSYNGQPMVAIGYDSRVDKFRKIETLWPNLHAGGTTPEGLCFEAIMKDFVGGTNNRDSYFLNFSDGQPMFSGDGFEYYGDQALHHTKKQVKEIIKKGISVMSYFVGDSEYDRTRNMDDFKTMYGKDAEFVDVTKVSSLAKTMNNLFLEKGK